MVRFVKILTLVGVALSGALPELSAEEGGQSPANADLEIRRRFSEFSRKVNELPELQKLREEVERAQRAYADAFEAALAREDAEILAKYRGLFEGRIRRLQANRVAEAAAWKKISASSEAREKALATPEVQAALQKWTSAISEAEKSQAKREYEEALKKATAAADAAAGSPGGPDGRESTGSSGE